MSIVSEMHYFHRSNERGVAHIALLVAALALIGFVVVSSSAEFKNKLFGSLFPKQKSQAAGFPIVFKDVNGNPLPINSQGMSKTTSATFKIELTSTLLAPPITSTPQPTPSSNPSGSITTAVSCEGSNIQVSVFGNIPSPSDRNLGLWSTLTDESRGQTMIYEYDGNQGSPTIRISANFPPTGAIRGSSMPVIGDGRPYTVRVYAAPFTNNIPQLTTPIAQAKFSKNCGPSGPVTITTPPTSGNIGTTSSVKGESTSSATPYTVSYKVGETPPDLDISPNRPYGPQEPTVLIYTLKDLNPGIKTIWVEFRDKDGRVDRKSAQIEFGTQTPSPTPTASPAASSRVFVTSVNYNGNLGGLSGADAKCQDRANAAKLGGTWKAWLSDNKTSASSRLIHSNSSYKLVNGTVIANSWADLTDGKLQSPITITETGSFNGNYVYSGTRENGDIMNPGTGKCADWTSSTEVNGPGLLGHSGESDYHWSWGTSYICSNPYPIYCFEQTSTITPPPPVPTPTPTPTPQPITCNPVQLNVNPPVGGVGPRTFAWNGNSSTYFANSFSPANSVTNCNPAGGSATGGSGTCVVNSSGVWTRTWKNCVGNINNCSQTCSVSVPFTVPTPTPIPTPKPTPTPIPQACNVVWPALPNQVQNPFNVANVTGVSSTNGWANVGYRIDGGSWNTNITVNSTNPPRWTLNSVQPGAAGGHRVEFGINVTTKPIICNPPATFSTLAVQPKPDLIIVAVQPLSTPRVNVPGNFNVVIRNNGAPVPPTLITKGILVDIAGRCRAPINPLQFLSLIAGANTSVSVNGCAPFPQAGQQVITAIVDPSNIVSESNEGNNQTSTRITVSR